MNPLLVIAIPIVLTMIGIALNSFYVVHDQPEYSLEADPIDKLAAERQANSRYFFLQRARILKRQKRVGQYGWLVLAVFIASASFLYSETVKVTTVSKQISAIRTFAADDRKGAVLSVTLGDGSSVQYLVKAAEVQQVKTPKTNELPKEMVQNFRLASLKTAVNVGDAKLPLGIALEIAN